MTLTRKTPQAQELGDVLDVLAGWQIAASPLQLHPGDIGWHVRLGLAQTASVLRTWSRGGEILAIGMFDGGGLLRIAVAPGAQQDQELTHLLVSDMNTRGSGALLPDAASVEVDTGVLLGRRLAETGWREGEPWTPLAWDLDAPISAPGVRIEVVGTELAAARVELQRRCFSGSTFTVEGWHTMTTGPTYREARCLLALDEHGAPVATTTVWSAGVGRDGLIEPLGVDPAHRGHGYGTAIVRAGVGMLRELGASRALVCTPSSNIAGVAAYRSAGFTALAERRDLQRMA